MVQLRTLNDIDITGKTLLYRVDLNVPMVHGKVADATRISRLVPTIQEMVKRRAKIVMLSHFGRPNGVFTREMSLAPITNALSEALGNKPIYFALDCMGPAVEEAVVHLKPGEILLLENLRFHPGEEKNDPDFVRRLAKLGDIYVNDTFSCSHREHASIVGLATVLPSIAGRLLQSEIEQMDALLSTPELPMGAIIGGAKISTKLSLLHMLIKKVQVLVVGGAMANTFLKAKGLPIGTSLYEADRIGEAKDILGQAEKQRCKVVLPLDVVTSPVLESGASCKVGPVSNVDASHMILDIGPRTVQHIATMLEPCKTIVWNGPLGAFEYRPFDVGTMSVARCLADTTWLGQRVTVAGGGDVVAALGLSGLVESFTYISTAGGAFLEWLEQGSLPGIKVLEISHK